MFDDESDDDRCGSDHPGMCSFPFCFENSVGCVSGVGSVYFVSTELESIGDVVPLLVFVPRGVESKCGRLIELFCRPKSGFSFLV